MYYVFNFLDIAIISSTLKKILIHKLPPPHVKSYYWMLSHVPTSIYRLYSVIVLML